MSAFALFDLDRQTAASAAVGIQAVIRARGQAGKRPLQGLAELHAAFAEVAWGHPGTEEDTEVDPIEADVYRGRHEHGALLTQRDAAELLGVDPKTVGRWLNRGILEGVGPLGRRRVPRSEVDRLLNPDPAGSTPR